MYLKMANCKHKIKINDRKPLQYKKSKIIYFTFKDYCKYKK